MAKSIFWVLKAYDVQIVLFSMHSNK